jgi:hypothetical protein
METQRHDGQNAHERKFVHLLIGVSRADAHMVRAGLQPDSAR